MIKSLLDSKRTSLNRRSHKTTLTVPLIYIFAFSFFIFHLQSRFLSLRFILLSSLPLPYVSLYNLKFLDLSRELLSLLNSNFLL